MLNSEKSNYQGKIKSVNEKRSVRDLYLKKNTHIHTKDENESKLKKKNENS